MNHTQYIQDVRLSTLLPADAKSVVTRGIDYLNQKYGSTAERNWFDLIELPILDMATKEYCVLGQLQLGLGDSQQSDEWLDYGPEWCRAHGFHLNRSDMLTYDELTDEWRHRIAAMYATAS